MNRSSFFLIILVCFLKNQYVIAGSIQTDIEDFGSLIGLDASNELHYIIHEDIDLKGKTVRLPANSYLRITRGKLKNGVIILDNTTLKCKKGAFEDVTIRGTIKNKFFLSSWLKINSQYSDLYSDAIRVACNSNSDFIFTKGIYRFKHPLFLYNKTNLRSRGNVVLEPHIKSPDNESTCFIIAGNDSLNVNGRIRGIKWEGIISGFDIVINESQEDDLDAVIGLYNASNCTVCNCNIDGTNLKVPIAHYIGAYNNARYANPSGGENIYIHHNRIKCQGSMDLEYSRKSKLLSCESIGVGTRKNIVIDHNNIINASDDLGVHSCNNVVVSNNSLESLNGRIYVSGTQNCDIIGNRLFYISPTQTGMGIKVTIEHPYQQPNKKIKIVDNLVDYTAASMDANYGIWVQGQDILIETNNLISNGAANARIWLDVIALENNHDSRFNNQGMLVPDNIVVNNNRAKILCFVVDQKYDIKKCIFSNNAIYGGWFECNRKEVLLKNNVVGK